MGNSCKHEKTEVVETIEENKSLLFNKKIVIVKCLDCLTNSHPTLIKKEITQGRISGHVYHSNNIDQNNCKHEKITVDDNTCEYHQRDSLPGIISGMLTAHWFEPKDHYIRATATCNKCESKLEVECSYSIENKWENYQLNKIVNKGSWKIVKKP